jgi:hypothetical protein
MADQPGNNAKTLARAPSHQFSVHDGHSQEANPHSVALKLAAAHEADDIDPTVEKKLLRKIDWRLMPLV